MNRSTRTELCDFPHCEKFKWTKGLCNTHYKQQWKGEELSPILHTMRGSKKPMHPVEIAWLAAHIDGEGCFSRKKTVVEIRSKSTDLDTVERCVAFSGMGRISGPYHSGAPNHQPIWEWRVSKRRDVFRLFLAIAPLLSARRKAKILELANEVFG